MALGLDIDIDPITVGVLVFMVVIIFAVAGATITVNRVTTSGKIINGSNNNNSNNANNNANTSGKNKHIDTPDEAYMSETTRKHILLEQNRYYTDTCPMI